MEANRRGKQQMYDLQALLSTSRNSKLLQTFILLRMPSKMYGMPALPNSIAGKDMEVFSGK